MGYRLIATVATAALWAGGCAAERASTPPPKAGPKPQRAARADPDRAKAKRSQAMALTRRLLDATRDPDQRAKLLFRLASLYLDQAEDCDRGRRELEERMATAPPEQTDRLAARAVEAGGCAGPMRAQAAKLLARLVQEHPRHPRTDEHLFTLATTLWDLGRRQDALKTWWKLIKMFPSSRYVPDAYLAVGEWYFNAAQLTKAIKAYQRVTTFSDSPVAPYAQYKLAWCHYNLQEFDKALEGFVTVARLDGSAPTRQLAEEARKDAVMAFAQAGAPNRAEAFFSELAPGKELALLSRLAGLWTDAGRYADAAAIDRLLIPRLVCDPAQLMAQSRLLQAQMSLGDHRQTAEEAERLVQLVHAQRACADPPDTAARLGQARAAQRAEARGLITRLADAWQREQQATLDAGLTPLIARLRAALESLDQVR